VLEVIRAGLLTTVQDAGRTGWARFGVPPAGPADWFALRAANILAGNDPGAAGLEITVAGPTLRTSCECVIAACGAEFEISAGSFSVETWRSTLVSPGSEIRFGERRNGARAYLAVSGGINVEVFLNSQATCLTGKFGGFEGRPLRPGDKLPLGPTKDKLTLHAGKVWPPSARPQYSPHPTLRAVMGPQDDHFTQEGLATFFDSEYKVTAASDRMGYRLRGPSVEHSGPAEIVSDGVVTGSVQIPGDGQPIVLMVDHPTTGGYPKIAPVIRADLPLIAQCLPGDSVRFRAVGIQKAQTALRAQSSIAR
jgi:antagonist of KipI